MYAMLLGYITECQLTFNEKYTSNDEMCTIARAYVCEEFVDSGYSVFSLSLFLCALENDMCGVMV